MKNTQNEKQIQLQAQLNTLLTTKNTLALSTINLQGLSDIGLIPFLFFEHNFYILISELSAHTHNLKTCNTASLLIHLGDEQAKNPFTDQRVSFQVTAKKVNTLDDASHATQQTILELMQNKLGKTISLLTSLGDFSLMQLSPNEGQLIVGFGAAYDIDVEHFELTHIDEQKVEQRRNNT